MVSEYETNALKLEESTIVSDKEKFNRGESSMQVEETGRGRQGEKQEVDRQKSGKSQKLAEEKMGKKAREAGSEESQSEGASKAGPSFQEHSTRVRAVGFTFQEDEMLFKGIIENYSALYGKESLSLSRATKNNLWKEIATAVSNVGVSPRNVEQCRRRYYVLCCKLNKKMSMMDQHRKGAKKGQPCPVTLSKMERRFQDIMCTVAVEGLPKYLDTYDVAPQEFHSQLPASETKDIPKDSMAAFEGWDADDLPPPPSCLKDRADATTRFKRLLPDVDLKSLPSSPVTRLSTPTLGPLKSQKPELR
uniref:Myb-related transcription factor, partner of profilin-like n=1 Tax=Geotrypetes seraphini TaxID=260995 RepID=A0A6P8NQD8_GEOSA|nr:myb-related transcription factor, partner of profilin-like [Geotrypetes seraphini]